METKMIYGRLEKICSRQNEMEVFSPKDDDMLIIKFDWDKRKKVRKAWTYWVEMEVFKDMDGYLRMINIKETDHEENIRNQREENK